MIPLNSICREILRSLDLDLDFDLDLDQVLDLDFNHSRQINLCELSI